MIIFTVFFYRMMWRKRNLLLLILLQLCSIVAASAHAEAGLPTVDLRQADLQQDRELNGQCFFYWQRFIPPGNTPAGAERVNFPFLWNGYN